jgi:hypothetical protein
MFYFCFTPAYSDANQNSTSSVTFLRKLPPNLVLMFSFCFWIVLVLANLAYDSVSSKIWMWDVQNCSFGKCTMFWSLTHRACAMLFHRILVRQCSLRHPCVLCSMFFAFRFFCLLCPLSINANVSTVSIFDSVSLHSVVGWLMSFRVHILSCSICEF